MSLTETLTPNETSPTNSGSNPSEPSPTLTLVEPKLYAGKYKSVEELEEAYKASERFIGENTTLKKQIEQHTKVPDDYEVPPEIAMRETEIAELKSIARNAGLNQEQFVKTAKDMQNRISYQLSTFEQAKQELGEANLNVLTDYVTKNYPERLREHVLNKLIKDKDAMSDAMKHRESILNTQAPGMDSGNAGKPEKFDGEKDLKAAAAAYHKNPRDKEAQKRYVSLAAEVGNERFGRK